MPFTIGLFLPTFRKNYNKVPASIWIRALQNVNYLKNLGVEVHVNNPFKFYDASIYYRGVSSNSVRYIKYLKLISKQIYWDTCVNYFTINQGSSAEQVFNARRILSEVDGVITTSDVIYNYANQYHKNVFLLEDPINFDHFANFKAHVDYNKPTFGWCGVSVKSDMLQLFSGDITRLIVISDKNFNVPGIQIEYHRWDYKEFPFKLNLCDIAFLPRDLTDIYNLSHSSFKALAYASQGIPIIANKLPSYQKLSNFYDSIVFIEDHQTIASCIQYLKTRSRQVEKLKLEYSCETYTGRLMKYLNERK